MFDADQEDLDPDYYARFAGRYNLDDNCALVVTISVVRLFVRDICTNEWRGMNQVNGATWSAGDTVISEQTIDQYTFVDDDGAWYRALEIEFDPAPIWSAYRGSATFVLAEHDDSMPTAVAVNRFANAASAITVRLLEDAQHLGRFAEDACKAGLDDVSRFAPGLFEVIRSVN